MLPANVHAAFDAWRTEVLAAMPKAEPAQEPTLLSPRVTLIYDCSGDKGLCMRTLCLYKTMFGPVTAQFKSGADLIVAKEFPVIVMPIASNSIMRIFDALYKDVLVNPRGTDSTMFFSKEDVTDSNPLGYCPHVTLAWFEAGTNMEPFREWVKAGHCPPPPADAFELCDFEFETFERPAYVVPKDAPKPKA